MLNRCFEELTDPITGDRGAALECLDLGSLFTPGFGSGLELRVAACERCKIEAVSLNNASSRVSPAVAFTVRAILHDDEAKLNQMTVQVLHLTYAQAHVLLLHRCGRPHDWPCSRLPVNRLGKPKQPVHGVNDVWAKPEVRSRRFKSG